jgi:hypothetical protein
MGDDQSEVADEKPHELRALFDSLDINGDGNVSKKELVKALKSRESDFYQVLRLPERTGSQRKSRAVARFFRSADDDGDSQLNFDEFVVAVKAVEQEAKLEEVVDDSTGSTDKPQQHRQLGGTASAEDQTSSSTEVASIQPGELALVRRSDDRWTYALLKSRSATGMEFDMDGNGACKIIPDEWVKDVRRLPTGATRRKLSEARRLDASSKEREVPMLCYSDGQRLEAYYDKEIQRGEVAEEKGEGGSVLQLEKAGAIQELSLHNHRCIPSNGQLDLSQRIYYSDSEMVRFGTITDIQLMFIPQAGCEISPLAAQEIEDLTGVHVNREQSEDPAEQNILCSDLLGSIHSQKMTQRYPELARRFRWLSKKERFLAKSDALHESRAVRMRVSGADGKIVPSPAFKAIAGGAWTLKPNEKYEVRFEEVYTQVDILGGLHEGGTGTLSDTVMRAKFNRKAEYDVVVTSGHSTLAGKQLQLQLHGRFFKTKTAPKLISAIKSSGGGKLGWDEKEVVLEVPARRMGAVLGADGGKLARLERTHKVTVEPCCAEEKLIYYTGEEKRCWYVGGRKSMEGGKPTGWLFAKSSAVTPDKIESVFKVWKTAEKGAGKSKFVRGEKVKIVPVLGDKRNNPYGRKEDREQKQPDGVMMTDEAVHRKHLVAQREARVQAVGENMVQAEEARVIELGGQEEDKNEAQHEKMGVYELLEDKIINGRGVWRRCGQAGLRVVGEKEAVDACIEEIKSIVKADDRDVPSPSVWYLCGDENAGTSGEVEVFNFTGGDDYVGGEGDRPPTTAYHFNVAQSALSPTTGETHWARYVQSIHSLTMHYTLTTLHYTLGTCNPSTHYALTMHYTLHYTLGTRTQRFCRERTCVY